MCLQTKVVISTVGPYFLYGFPLVEACVECKTDYVDLTGGTFFSSITAEPHFIREIILKFHDKAVANNVLIVPSCGFDSIPSDLGAHLIANEFKSIGLKTSSIRYGAISASGGVSGGTIASAVSMMNNLSIKEMGELRRNPDYLNPDIKSSPGTWNGTFVVFDKGLKRWLFPFVMETANLRYVRRTNQLLGYGDHFQYREGIF